MSSRQLAGVDIATPRVGAEEDVALGESVNAQDGNAVLVTVKHDDDLGVVALPNEVDGERASADAISVMVGADDFHAWGSELMSG